MDSPSCQCWGRTTGTWYLDAPPDPVTGKRRQASKGGFRTKREAQEALNQALTRLRDGTFVLPSQRTLGSFLLEEWLPALGRPGSGHRPGRATG
jgi:hypothetical protein